MTNQFDENKIWLVKSASKIIGPFTQTEVEELIRLKNIGLLDEVKTALGRWKYLREYSEFEVLARESLSQGDQSQTQTHATQTLSKTVEIADEELTLTPLPLKVKSDVKIAPSPALKDIEILRERNLNQEIQLKKIKVQQNFIKAILLIFIAFIIHLAWQNYSQKTKLKNKFNESLAEASRFLSLKMYDQALFSYRSASALTEPPLDLQKQMAVLFIAKEKQTALGRRLLEARLNQENLDRDHHIESLLGISLSYILEGNETESYRTLQKVLSLEPQNATARFNLAMLALRQGDLNNAKKYLYEVRTTNELEALTELAKVVLAEDISLGSQSVQQKKSAEESHAHARSFLLFENLLLSFTQPTQRLAYTSERLQDLALAFLNKPQDFVYDIKIDVDPLWRHVYNKNCLGYFDDQVHPTVHKVIKSFCLQRELKSAESLRLMREAFAENPKDLGVVLSMVVLLIDQQMYNDAFAIIKTQNLNHTQGKLNVVMAYACLKVADYKCAQEQSEKVLRGGFQINAAQSLIVAALSLQNKSDAQSKIKEALQNEPQFLPFLLMREQMERGESR